MAIHASDTEEFEEETLNVLVCEDNNELKGLIISALEGLKYGIESAATPDEAFEKLKFNQYGAIVLDERFGGSPENNSLYAHLRIMPMPVRRNIFLVLVGKDFKTDDNMTAFAKSANLVVNEKDLPNLKAILKKSVADNDHFYKVFKESLVKMGKR